MFRWDVSWYPNPRVTSTHVSCRAHYLEAVRRHASRRRQRSDRTLAVHFHEPLGGGSVLVPCAQEADQVVKVVKFRLEMWGRK